MSNDELLEMWRLELDSLMESLESLGSEPSGFAYNLKATEALRLSKCIINLQDAIRLSKRIINLQDAIK